ncbi:Septum formation protein Maf [Lachnospiraceae bacterium TWA4]|nr:Septum formation protein Maf [Lachnospiraceae bacterium TWA4]
MRIVLASGSPRRRELLDQAGYNYQVVVSDVDEETDLTNPKEYVLELSRRKAKDVYQKLVKTDKMVVIGADTVVSLNDKILGKPKDYEDAYQMLKSLSGQTHHVYTGVSLVYYDGDKLIEKSFCECTQVLFYPMSHEEITWYLDTKEPFDKAGSYGIQGKGGIFVKEIRGDYNNVVGLPLARLYHELDGLN